jgi:ankyrin repeat protein
MNNYVQPLGGLLNRENSPLTDVFMLRGHGMVLPEDSPLVQVPENTIFITTELCGDTGKINQALHEYPDGKKCIYYSLSITDNTFLNLELKKLLESPIPSTPEEKLYYNNTLKRLTKSKYNANFPGEFINDGAVFPFLGWYDRKDYHIYAMNSGIYRFYIDDTSYQGPRMETIRSKGFRITTRGNCDSFKEEGAFDSIEYNDIAPLYEGSLYPTQSSLEQNFTDDMHDVSTYDEFNTYIMNKYSIVFSELFNAKNRVNRGTDDRDPEIQTLENNAIEKYNFITSRPTVIIQPNCRTIPEANYLISKNNIYSSPTSRPPQRQLSNSRDVRFLEDLPLKLLLKTRLSDGTTYLMDNIILGRDDSVMAILNRLKVIDPVQSKNYINKKIKYRDTTALQLAISNRRINIIIELLKMNIEDINILPKDIRTDAYLYSYNNKMDISTLLQERNINYTSATFAILDRYKNGSLSMDDTSRDETEIKTLLTKGADITAKDSNGNTFMYAAIARGFYDIVSILIAKKATGNDITEVVLRSLITSNQNVFKILKLLLETYPSLRFLINKRIPLYDAVTGTRLVGETLLMAAVKQNNIPVVKLLLEYGADKYIVVNNSSSKVARNLAINDEMKAAINSVKMRSRRNRRQGNKTRKRR